MLRRDDSVSRRRGAGSVGLPMVKELRRESSDIGVGASIVAAAGGRHDPEPSGTGCHRTPLSSERTPLSSEPRLESAVSAALDTDGVRCGVDPALGGAVAVPGTEAEMWEE